MVAKGSLLTPEELERFERLSAEAEVVAGERAALRLRIGMHLSWEVPDSRWLDESRLRLRRLGLRQEAVEAQMSGLLALACIRTPTGRAA